MSEAFQTLDNLLAKGIFASYLLGYDQALEETRLQIAEMKQTELAEKPFRVDFEVSPEEAIDYFRRKKILNPKEFKKLAEEAKAGAFSISEVYRKEVLEAFKEEIQKSLETGQSQKEVIKSFKAILAGASHKELGTWHLESIFRTNMQVAYGVGRRRGLEEVAEELPLWEYSAVNDDRTRPTHRALDGIIYPANHEFWNTHFPPWGFACRCTVTARFDYPTDYNHLSPNPDTQQLYLDDKGLPEKAEYLTNVYDLKATKFVGVPKNSSLEEIFKEIAKIK